MNSGELPLAIGMLKANGCRVSLDRGFTLASDISAVANATKLDFSGLGLEGNIVYVSCATQNEAN